MVETPELDKRSKILDKSHVVGEFLDWLSNVKGWSLAAYVTELDFDPGHRFMIKESTYRGQTRYRVEDRGKYFGNRSTYYDTREEAEAVTARKDALWLAEATSDENKVYRQQHFSPEQLLAEFFGIDLGKVEDERRALLKELRG